MIAVVLVDAETEEIVTKVWLPAVPRCGDEITSEDTTRTFVVAHGPAEFRDGVAAVAVPVVESVLSPALELLRDAMRP